MSKKQKIHQFLRESGLFTSKGEILRVLEAGRVEIGGVIIKNPEYQFKLREDVFVDRKRVSGKEEHLYLLLHKPRGYVCHKINQTQKQAGKKSIFSILPDSISFEDVNRLTCVGRLDEDTTGLLIITSDGKLNHFITNPMHSVEKTYGVVLEKPLSLDAKKKIEEGIVIILEEDGEILKYKTKPSFIKMGHDASRLEITISEGKKRVVRRSFEAVNNHVVDLCRLRIGKLELDSEVPKVGQVKKVTKEYIMAHLQ